MTNPQHTSARYIAVQTGASTLGLMAGEVGTFDNRRPLAVRLAVMAAQFAVVALCVIVVAAWVAR